jgi:UTP--glucose-1-phosphate uridylyltransferase
LHVKSVGNHELPAANCGFKIKQVVITAAGIGTRLLTVTKEQPKEMLPLFDRRQGDGLHVKPILQMIFEHLYRFGFRDFCIIVGRGKRVIEDHFTIDRDFLKQLSSKGKHEQLSCLEQFYQMIEDSTIVWINQPEPKGFGHAVLMAQPFLRNEPFLVHAGDTIILSNTDSFLERLLSAHQKEKVAATLLVKEVENPKIYGVAEVQGRQEEIFAVKKVIEKPFKPQTNLAIMPIYVFDPAIIPVLKNLKPGKSREIQLTDGIQEMLSKGNKVQAIKLGEDEARLDVGTPETYWEAIRLSHEYSEEKLKNNCV